MKKWKLACVLVTYMLGYEAIDVELLFLDLKRHVVSEKGEGSGGTARFSRPFSRRGQWEIVVFVVVVSETAVGFVDERFLMRE